MWEDSFPEAGVVAAVGRLGRIESLAVGALCGQSDCTRHCG